MVALAPLARTCQAHLPEIVFGSELHRLRIGDQITVFVREGDANVPWWPIVRHVGVFAGWHAVYCLEELLLDQGLVEPRQVHTEDIEWIECE